MIRHVPDIRLFNARIPIFYTCPNLYFVINVTFLFLHFILIDINSIKNLNIWIFNHLHVTLFFIYIYIVNQFELIGHSRIFSYVNNIDGNWIIYVHDRFHKSGTIAIQFSIQVGSRMKSSDIVNYNNQQFTFYFVHVFTMKHAYSFLSWQKQVNDYFIHGEMGYTSHKYFHVQQTYQFVNNYETEWIVQHLVNCKPREFMSLSYFL